MRADRKGATLAVTPRDTDDAFLREVDEGVRADQLAAFWNRYGIALVVGIVVFLAALGGWLWWRDAQATAAGVAGEDFTQAQAKLDVGDAPAALPVLQRLAGDGPKGYRPLATMMLAAQAVTAGDAAKAGKLYDQVAADGAAAQPLRDAATIKAVRLRYDEMTPQAVIDRLSPLAQPGNAWFGIAGEMVAIAKLKTGDTNGAKALLTAIVRDQSAPPTLRERAGQLALSLGVDIKLLNAPSAAPAQ